MDYVFGWLDKAADYIVAGGDEFALVTTNSVTQGTQIPIYWPHLLGKGLAINFAHTSFKWQNNASNNAGVTCVIVGVGRPREPRTIYRDGLKQDVSIINPYLLPSDVQVVEMRSKPISALSRMNYGNLPGDGNYLTLSLSERTWLEAEHPEAARLVIPLLGAQELIRGLSRYCLWIDDDDRALAESVPFIQARIEGVLRTRVSSKDKSYNDLAGRPHQFRDRNLGRFKTILLPTISSESREFLPAGVLPGRTGTTNQCYALYDAPIWNFAVAVSKMHLAWIATVCGKLESRYRYSNTLGWNTFPLPKLTAQNEADLSRCAENILLAREAHFPATIADLYDPESMPDDLRRAHEANDEVLERIYIGRRFRNDTERLEKLFELYTRMTTQKFAA